MWACEWKFIKDTQPDIKDRAQKLFKSKIYHAPKLDVRAKTREETSRKISKLIVSGALFGLCEIDIEVPEPLRYKFAEMQPLYKNVNIGIVIENLTMKNQFLRPNDV